ncbi:M20 family metallopeptidase [Rhabdothermincola salaria]|uniref:M20 family metallopeptidase n=1 Tax=Rhabdothermincola salaria TaxID=2903142 RepID=UPI001E4D0245|nr:M20 family metallopeptidase [Rhabdothermincola salaria]MCD9623082.1 M20 family metallopeptidase [Rhabdothermincola salaria]
MDVRELKDQVCAEIDRRAGQLIGVSHDIHAHPEENFEEHHAHDLLTTVLEEAGLDTTRAAYGLETAFDARRGEGGPTVAVMLEYDALPGLGHACGHNIIAAAGLGAGLAAATVAERLGGSLRVLGTPAEEGGGGKVLMTAAGALDGVDAALMVHPADHDLRQMTTIAIQRLRVAYAGEAAHAAAFPWNGRNALDAAVLGYNAVAALRQHIRPDERIHGVFTDGGDKPNIVPAHAAMLWYVRSGTLERLQPLKSRVLDALRSGAMATGCDVTHEWLEPAYAELRSNTRLEDLYAANSAHLGRLLLDPEEGLQVCGSTDMGNVSQEVPSIHPMIAVAPEGVSIHTPEFAHFAAGPEGDAAVLDGAKAMAMTIVDLWARPGILTEDGPASRDDGPR